MKLGKIALVTLLLGSLVFGWEGNISWDPPTENTDGTILLEQDLDFYTFFCDGVPLATIDSIIGTRTATVSTLSLAEGSHNCWLTVTALNGQESDPSEVRNFIIGPRVPGAPTNFVINL